MKFVVLALPISAMVTHLTHLQLDRAKPGPEAPAQRPLPSIEAVQTLSLGYSNLAADYYWLQTLNEFGSHKHHKAEYPNVQGLLERTMALDPYFAKAYVFAGTVLTLNYFDRAVASKLLKQGMEHRPDVWEIPFYLGFNAYYFDEDYTLAKEALTKAATFEDAPPIVGLLAARLNVQFGEAEVGLEMVHAILQRLQDEELIAVYEKRRDQLTVELHLKWLREAKRRFEEKHGKLSTLHQLVEVGLLKEVPQAPSGDGYFVTSDGAIAVHGEWKRLELKK